jgi:signal transduction histidine kinase/ligand-binding sensor domain-containing protein/DNA-binding response OmpR family regulator
MKRTSFFLHLIFSFATLTGIAQPEYSFKHLNINQGLSNNQISCIFRDSKGFMWFGTSSGLNRYDGNSFRIFTHSESDPSTIIDNSIVDIQEDFQNNLWINTGAGYAIYRPENETFMYPAHPYLKKLGLTDTASFVYIDNAKNLWVTSSHNNCYRYSPQEKIWLRVDAFSKSQISDMAQRGEYIYATVNNGPIISIASKTLNINKMESVFDKFQLPNTNSSTLFVDSDNDFWLFQRNDPDGIYFFSLKKQTWQHFTNSTGSAFKLSSNTVRDITQDSQNLIWIATDHGGINIINKTLETITYLDNQPEDSRSLADKSVTCLYCDKENTMWAGTYKYGISYYNESIFKFNHIRQKKTDLDSDFDNDLNRFQEDLEGNLWIGSNNKGLVRIDHVTKRQTIFQHNPSNQTSLSNNVIVSLLCDRKGQIWAGTYQGGLNCYNGNGFIHYKHQPNNPNSIANDNIWDLIEDHNGNLWIATLGGGLDFLNVNTMEFTHYNNSHGPLLSSDFVICLLETQDKNILIGTAHGLTIYYAEKKEFKIINGNFSGSKQLVDQNVQSIYEDSRGLIWVGTKSGLNILNPKTDDLILLNKESGIADNVICDILEDDNKNIWISTTNGLSHIILNTNPKTGEYNFTFNNYDEKDGLQGKAFNDRSAYKTASGELLFGGTNGYNSVLPSQIKYNTNRPKLIFTDFLLFNKPVAIDSVYRGRPILEKSIANTSQVILLHSENIFTLEFSALNLLQPDKTTYSYKLNGFDLDWTTLTGNRHSATYTNLNPGDYTFQVKAANNDGFWSEKPIELKIKVKPPIWRTTLAYILYYLGITLILLFAATTIRNRVRMRFQMAQERLEAKRTKELDEMKLRFFTNISHEFRTQISLIIIPLEKQIKNTENEDDKRALKMINRNANRLLQLVNQLLDFRKLEVHGHKLNLSTGDVVQFIRETCLTFSEMYEKKNMHLTFSTVTEEIRMNFDEDKVSKIVTNLLSNAYKFTPVGGNIHVKLSLNNNQANQPMLRVSVADNGIGVKDEDKSKIFERFYQVGVPDTKATGSGIGLHLCKEYVGLHGGEIWMENNGTQGSIFVFTIPIVNSTLTDIETHEKVETLSNHGNATEGLEKLGFVDSRKTILVVEDNEDFRTFLRESLMVYYNVLEADNGKTAFDLVIQHLPDMVISDVMMPETDGYELCRLLKNDVRSSHIPIILLTARTAKEHIVQGLEIGADDYITKPFNLDILFLRLNKLLEQRAEMHHQIKQKREINPSEINISSLDEKLIEKAIKCVEDNIDNADFSVEILSHEMSMSRVHLYKKLLSITGKTPIEFIRIIRLKRAAQLLAKSQLSVSEIAYQVGFNNPKYFSRYFKEEFGMLPSVYADKGKKNQ